MKTQTKNKESFIVLWELWSKTQNDYHRYAAPRSYLTSKIKKVMYLCPISFLYNILRRCTLKKVALLWLRLQKKLNYLTNNKVPLYCYENSLITEILWKKIYLANKLCCRFLVFHKKYKFSKEVKQWHIGNRLLLQKVLCKWQIVDRIPSRADDLVIRPVPVVVDKSSIVAM